MTDTEEIINLARSAVESFIREGQLLQMPANVPERLRRSAACFVSIKTEHGALRGCIGTIEPLYNTLAEEIIANAASAATRDPRFLPVTVRELPSLSYSVDVLSEPEPTQFEELDPKIYGVIVQDSHGLRRGLLLPDIEGISTAQQQVEVAARKAGIPYGDPLTLYRFHVERFRN